MKKDEKAVIVERVLKASPAKIWKALTDRDQMKQWYFDLERFVPEVGFEFQFAGQGTEGEHYAHHCKITEVIPQKRLTYSWRYEGYEGMSYVTFELAPEGATTKVTVTHKGLHSFPDLPAFDWKNFQKGWTELIGTLLKNFVE